MISEDSEWQGHHQREHRGGRHLNKNVHNSKHEGHTHNGGRNHDSEDREGRHPNNGKANNPLAEQKKYKEHNSDKQFSSLVHGSGFATFLMWSCVFVAGIMGVKSSK